MYGPLAGLAPAGPRMGRSAVGAATAHHRPAAERSGAGLDRYYPGKRSGPPRGSVAGLAGQISSGQIGVGGLDGQFRAARAAGGARGGQFRRTGQASTPARRWPAAPAAATAAGSPAVPRPLQGRTVGLSGYAGAVPGYSLHCRILLAGPVGPGPVSGPPRLGRVHSRFRVFRAINVAESGAVKSAMFEAD